MSPQRNRLATEGSTGIGREIESKAAPRGDRREFRSDDDRAERALQHAPADFDIQAWFALEQAEDDQSRERGIAECWYG